MPKIPEKIQKGQPVIEQTERKINAIIDCLHGMQPKGDGDRIHVSETPNGTIISFANTGAIKEVVQTRQVIPWQYQGPWQCRITADGLNLEVVKGPLQINGRFLSEEDLPGDFGLESLSQIFEDFPGTYPKTLYITLCCYLVQVPSSPSPTPPPQPQPQPQPGSQPVYKWAAAIQYFDSSQLIHLWNDTGDPVLVDQQIKFGGRGYAVIGEVRRERKEHVEDPAVYNVGQYIPGIPQIMACAYTQTTPAVDRYLHGVE